MYAELQDILDNRAQLANEQRQLEADAYSILRLRPTYFALKLLFGLNHKAPEPETGEPEETEAVLA